MKRKKDEVDEKLVEAYWNKNTVNYSSCSTEITNIVNSVSDFTNEKNEKNLSINNNSSNLRLTYKHAFIISAVLFAISIYGFFAHFLYIPFLIISVIFGFYGYHLLVQSDIEKQYQQLDDVRQNMQDLINPNRMYERLGVDILSLQVGSNLLEIADPDAEGTLLPKLSALRQRLTDTLGYIIPNVRVLDSQKLKGNEYAIRVRDNLVSTGVVYPKKFMVSASDWEYAGYVLPKNVIISFSPLDGEKVYWMCKTETKNKDISYLSAEDVIIEHLKDCCIKYIHKIMEKTDILKIMELVRSQDPTLVNDLVPLFISAIDLKAIFVNLISKGISIKDVIYIFEVLNDHARYTSDVNRLTDILIKELTGFKL